MRATLAQIERHNPAVNAIVTLQDPGHLLAEAAERDARLARGESAGPLHGFPLAVKDFDPVRGLPFSQGSPIFRDRIAPADSIMAGRLRRGGAVFTGKTNIPEFGLGSHTYNPVHGATGNAYDQSKSAGGSSGGAAVSVALRMQPVADGSDHAGSLRNPPAFNNLFGLRTSYGRIPIATPDVFSPGFGVSGAIGRSPADIGLMLSVQAGADPRVPFSIPQDPSVFAGDLTRGRVRHPDRVARRFRRPTAVRARRARPRRRRAVRLRGGRLPRRARRSRPSTWSGCGAPTCCCAPAPTPRTCARSTRTRRSGALLKPEAVWEVEHGMALTADVVRTAQETRTAWYETVRLFMDRFDVLVMPSAQVFPFAIEADWPKQVGGRAMDT